MTRRGATAQASTCHPRGASVPLLPRVQTGLIRIISDLHFGEHASFIRDLDELAPLAAGVAHLIINGDAIDTRPTPHAAHTAACRAALQTFAGRAGVPLTFLSGNHDPDVAVHAVELAGGQVVVTHGDVMFDAIVPWGRDASLIGRRIRDALDGRAPDALSLDERFTIWRSVAAGIPQRHQSERNRLKYAAAFALDLFWPPLRWYHVLHTWATVPRRGEALLSRYWPNARFIALGHSHRPGVWRRPGGRVVINTGSFTPPLGAYTIELAGQRIAVRNVERRQGAFHPGTVVADFTLEPR